MNILKIDLVLKKNYSKTKFIGDENRGERREVKYLSNAKINLLNNFSPYYFKN